MSLTFAGGTEACGAPEAEMFIDSILGEAANVWMARLSEDLGTLPKASVSGGACLDEPL